jgi:hypothetical protein
MADECDEDKSESIDGPDVYPSEDELPDDPPDIDDAPIADKEPNDGENLLEFALRDRIESTPPAERIRSVMRHTDLTDEEMLTMEQLAIAMEISDENTAPDEVAQIDPEDIDGPGNLDLTDDG